MRAEEARSGEAPERVEVAARRSSQETEWRPLERVAKRARSRSGSLEGRRPRRTERPVEPMPVSPGTTPSKTTVTSSRAGEDEASAGGVEAQGSELDVGLLGVALEGGLEDAGLGAGVQATRQGRGLHRAEGGAVGAVAHRDGLGSAGAGGDEAVHAEQVLGRDGRDAGAEADDGVGPGAAGGESREAGLGEVEEAGDEEPLRAVLLREGVEAARAQLEGHARARALDDAERDVGRVAVRGPLGRGTTFRAGLGRPWRRRGLRGGRSRRWRARSGERRRRHRPVRRHPARTIQVLEAVEVRRPVAQARVEVAVALALGRGAEPGDERLRQPLPGAVLATGRGRGGSRGCPAPTPSPTRRGPPTSKPVARKDASLTAVKPLYSSAPMSHVETRA